MAMVLALEPPMKTKRATGSRRPGSSQPSRDLEGSTYSREAQSTLQSYTLPCRPESQSLRSRSPRRCRTFPRDRACRQGLLAGCRSPWGTGLRIGGRWLQAGCRSGPRRRARRTRPSSPRWSCRIDPQGSRRTRQSHSCWRACLCRSACTQRSTRWPKSSTPARSRCRSRGLSRFGWEAG